MNAAVVLETFICKGNLNNHQNEAEDSNTRSSTLGDLLCGTDIKTLRLEQRRDNPRNERFLLFCSDKPGCVGKVIFSTIANHVSSNENSLATAKSMSLK